MSTVQKVIVGVMLTIALASGVAVYLKSRPASIPDDIYLLGLDGQQHSLAEFEGQPLLINFWATWCPPCRREIPLLMDIQRQYADQGLVVIGIAVEDAQPVLALAESTPFNYPILIGENEALEMAMAMGIQIIGMPYSVFVDRNGRVSRIHTGELHREDAEKGLASILP